MIKTLLKLLITMLIVSCEHSDYEVTEFTGDYRYYAGIAEFFDCAGRVKYYVADSGVNTELQDLYTRVNLKEKEDIYIKVKGYLKEEKQMEGIDPVVVFVPVKLLNHDINRGCKRGIRQGY